MSKKVFINNKQYNLLKEYIESGIKIGLPREIVKALQFNKTSLGIHPSFPPEDEFKFEYKILSRQYEKILSNLNILYPEQDNKNITFYKNELSKLLIECKQQEQFIKPQLVELCINIVKNIFNINDEDVILNIELVDSISPQNIKLPLQPESIEDIEFDGIEELQGINDEIYKRRLINSLMRGISDWYIHSSIPFQEIYQINPKLLYVYPTIVTLNDFLLYNKNLNLFNENEITQGSTSEVIVKKNDRSVINVQGVNFISLLYESIRALLDLISFNGLPKDMKKIKYILKKSDFILAFAWDSLFGMPLWNLIIDKTNVKENDDIVPHLFYEIIIKPVDEFNNDLQNIFANTKKGKELISSLCDGIRYSLDKESFENDLNKQKEIYLNDNNYFDLEDF